MTPIAMYRECIPGILRRKFSLHSDRVVVNSSFSLGNKHEQSVVLADLRPQFDKAWVRTRHCRLAMFALILCSPIIIVPFFSSTTPLLRAVFFAIYIVFVVYFLVSLRRVEFTCFNNRSGMKLLDIGRIGPDTDRYDEFVSLLVKQIEASESSSD